jgi:ABC-type Fe3+ transport system substrate-binding protein
MEPADSDSLAIIKNPAHSNATKICLNWPLSREGQEIVSRLRKYAPGVLTSIRNGYKTRRERR